LLQCLQQDKIVEAVVQNVTVCEALILPPRLLAMLVVRLLAMLVARLLAMLVALQVLLPV
jgi:hypothetical protein